MRSKCLFFLFTQDGSTALIYAAQNGHSDVVSLLVEAHADINLPDEVKSWYKSFYTLFCLTSFGILCPWFHTVMNVSLSKVSDLRVTRHIITSNIDTPIHLEMELLVLAFTQHCLWSSTVRTASPSYLPVKSQITGHNGTCYDCVSASSLLHILS